MQNTDKHRTILLVTLINAAGNTLLAIAKIIFGSIGHSQALIADGIHSFSDLISDGLVYITARASTFKPDSEHPYGHQRIETLGTIIVSLVLCFIAISIGYEAIARLIHHTPLEAPTLLTLIVALVSIFANEGLFFYSHAAGRKINSALLISNAWHKRTDSFISLIVLLSIIGGLVGWRWLDPIGALIITVLIFKMALQMMWQAVQELIDRGVDLNTLDQIKKIIKAVPGVRSIHQLRTRLHSNSIFVDLHIIVDPYISVSEGHHIGEEVHLKLLQGVENLSDVTVHIDPENDELSRPSLHLPNRETVKRLLAERWHDLPGYSESKKMTLHYLEGHLYIEIFMKEDAMKSITHQDLLLQYQNRIRDIQEIGSVVIHCMPINKSVSEANK